MQVTHVADNVTHAVIGKGQARDFGISNSTEFFNILSNTLYSDKILAVVREVLCNAWDIHIQTGRTDRPVDVSLEGGKLTIRDYGTGISDEDIHPIYAVYGNSTKKLDGTQTGGFGLGSKAPFAYVDHFEVTSFHKGVKTVYAVSKSSAEVAGKPSIQSLVSVPCGDESGLQVSLAVKHEDLSRFKEVIHTIAKFGEMNVRYNGTQRLSTIPFSQAKHGFLMTKDVNGISGSQNHKIFVRYGNVVYPVPDHQNIKVEYAKVVQLIEKVGNARSYGYGTTWKIIFQARPDTISVTPSRESLSMTDHTVDSIKELLKAFLDLTSSQLQEACIQIERELVERVWKEGRVVDLLTSDNKVPQLFDRTQIHTWNQHKDIVQEPVYVSDVKQLGRSYMSRAYPDFPKFREHDINMRLDILEKAELGGPKNRGKIQSFRRRYALEGNVNGVDWYLKTLVNPLVKRLDEVPELSGSKLLVYGHHRDLTEDRNGRRRFSSDGTRFVEATKLSKRNLEEYMRFLRNMVVISFNRIDVEERLPQFPIMKDELGKPEDFFVYVVSRADKKIEIVRKFFADQGMTVVDLTVRQDWEPKHVLEPVAKVQTVKKPRKKGLPLLSEILSVDHRGAHKLNYERYAGAENMDTVKRTEDPKFVVQFNPRAQSADLFPGLDTAAKLAVVMLYGDQGGVTVNDNQFSRFTNELNIPSVSKWLLTKLKEEVNTNPRLQLAFGFSHEKLGDDADKMSIAASHQKQQLLKTILRNPDLAIEFGVLNEMTREDRLLMRVIKGMTERHNWHWRHDKDVEEMRKHIEAVKPTPEVEAVAALVAKSELVGLLNTSVFSGVFGENPTTSQKTQRSGALDILQYVLA